MVGYIGGGGGAVIRREGFLIYEALELNMLPWNHDTHQVVAGTFGLGEHNYRIDLVLGPSMVTLSNNQWIGGFLRKD